MARNDAEYNRYAIAKAVRGYIRQEGCLPTVRHLAEALGLSESTISKHLKSINLESSKAKLRVLTEDVLLAVYEGAMAGKTPAQRLWMEVVEDWSPAMPAEQMTTPPSPPQPIIFEQSIGGDSPKTSTNEQGQD